MLANLNAGSRAACLPGCVAAGKSGVWDPVLALLMLSNLFKVTDPFRPSGFPVLIPNIASFILWESGGRTWGRE